MPSEFKRVMDNIGYIEIPLLGTTSNVYVIGTKDESIIFDCGSADTACEVVQTLEKHGYTGDIIKAIVVSHGHVDHYGGAGVLSDWAHAPVWAHVATAGQMFSPWSTFVLPYNWINNFIPENWKWFQEKAGKGIKCQRLLYHGDIIEAAGMRLEVLEIPGHERGAICLADYATRAVFVGDLIQGGMDASSNWLGLFTDIASQKASLDLISKMQAVWLFKGHRIFRTNGEVMLDIQSAQKRLEAIESAILDILTNSSGCNITELAMAVYKTVLGRCHIDELLPEHALVTVHAFLVDMSLRGLVKRNQKFIWEAVTT